MLAGNVGFVREIQILINSKSPAVAYLLTYDGMLARLLSFLQNTDHIIFYRRLFD
jgi:hypothetical protein